MATIDDVAEKLAAHERIMQDRYEHLEKGLEEIKRAEGAEGKDMAGTVNVESSPLGGLLPLMMGGGWGGGSTAGAVGGGLGAGVLGGILGGALGGFALLTLLARRNPQIRIDPAYWLRALGRLS